MTLPRLFASTPEAFAQLFNIEILLFDILGLFIIAALSRRLKLSLWKTLSVYTVALIAIGPIITIRYDLIVAIIVLLSIYAFTRGNHKTSWALLAIGVMTKIYPIVIAPLYLLYYRRNHKNNKQLLTGIGTFALTTAVIVIPALLISPEGFWQSFTYHAERPLQIESTYSSALLLGQLLGFTSVATEFSFGSQNVVSPLATFLAKVSPLVMLLSLLGVYWFFNKAQREAGTTRGMNYPIPQSETVRIISYSLIAILVFMITSKVLSPQFIIWLFPLIPLVSGRWRNTPWLMFVMIGFMTYFVYPKYYGGIIEGHPLIIGMLFLRNASLVFLAFLLPRVSSRPQLGRGLGKQLK